MKICAAMGEISYSNGWWDEDNFINGEQCPVGLSTFFMVSLDHAWTLADRHTNG